MPGLVNALVMVAVVAVVLVRQFRARPISTDRRWWLLPGILMVVALRQPGAFDVHHRAASAVILTAELLISLATGAGWAWTSRIWTEPDGVVWTRSTKASIAVWAVGIAARIGILALGTTFGVHQDSSALMLGFAGTLLVRAGIMVWRARSLGSSSSSAAAYGDATRSAWKEHV
ncbi:DUF1453 domain-containing protein [Streptomyces sp. NK08204]|uniref:DUF1453 domain-containing protein n=1 Tax=Streptomyces sp. NK08204 TaxID=2873260 RepID=UPI001CED940F|nr:DUF1453 domain-containing protein [Streptomyces sp. NK08204]